MRIWWPSTIRLSPSMTRARPRIVRLRLIERVKTRAAPRMKLNRKGADWKVSKICSMCLFYPTSPWYDPSPYFLLHFVQPPFVLLTGTMVS